MRQKDLINFASLFFQFVNQHWHKYTIDHIGLIAHIAWKMGEYGEFKRISRN